MKSCHPSTYLSHCRIQGKDWCRVFLASDWNRLPYAYINALGQVAYQSEG